jgi:Cys-tRNA(Pro) deacylase
MSAIDAKVQRVIDAGKQAGIEVSPVRFANETRTAADAAREVGCEVGRIVKSLVFVADGDPVLLLVSGANRVDLAAAAAELGADKLERSDAETARRATGYSIGATPPFGLATDLRILIDEDLLTYDTVWAAAGRPDSVFEVDPKSLVRATGAISAPLAD